MDPPSIGVVDAVVPPCSGGGQSSLAAVVDVAVGTVDPVVIGTDPSAFLALTLLSLMGLLWLLRPGVHGHRVHLGDHAHV